MVRGGKASTSRGDGTKKGRPRGKVSKGKRGVLLHLYSQEKKKFTNLGLGNVHPRLPQLTFPNAILQLVHVPGRHPRRARSTSPPTSTRARSNSPSGVSSTTPPPAARSRTPSQSLLYINAPHQAKKMKQVDVQDQENTERESSTQVQSGSQPQKSGEDIRRRNIRARACLTPEEEEELASWWEKEEYLFIRTMVDYKDSKKKDAAIAAKAKLKAHG